MWEMAWMTPDMPHFLFVIAVFFINKWLVEIIFYQKKTLHLHGVI